MPEFPPQASPNWIDDYSPPKRANSLTEFDAGTVSRLRLTDVKSRATFTAMWDFKDQHIYKVLMEFWDEVQDDMAFTLPNEFFNCNMPGLFKRDIVEASPLRTWRIQELTTEATSYDSRTVTMQFISEIDP